MVEKFDIPQSKSKCKMAETDGIVIKNSEKMEDQWSLKPDGCLYVGPLGSQVTDIIFHSNLNVMLVFGQSNGLKVLDINSGVILQSTELGGMFHQFDKKKICSIHRLANRMEMWR